MIENGNGLSPADFSALMGNNRTCGGFGNRGAVYDTQADIQRGFDRQSLMAVEGPMLKFHAFCSN